MVKLKASQGPLPGMILSYLSETDGGSSSKGIQMHLQKLDAKNEWSKSNVKSAINLLVSRGKIFKDGKKYAVASDEESSNSDDDSSSGISDDESEAKQQVVPIAERMRQSTLRVDTKSSDKVDYDDEIKRLEAELAAGSESDVDSEDIGSSSDNGDDDGEPKEKKKISFGENTTHTIPSATKRSKHSATVLDANRTSSGIICLSTVADERIEPLPASALPQNAPRKSINYASENNKKRKREQKQEHTINEGLKSAVHDLLSNYKTRSEFQQPPFYCRVCQHQSKDEAEFLAHKASDFHEVAMKEEKKKTYCKMCRKQMTSVVQFEEHLNSKPHKEQLDYLRGKQRSGMYQDGDGETSGRGEGVGEREGDLTTKGEVEDLIEVQEVEAFVEMRLEEEEGLIAVVEVENCA
eukprot:g2497.t1 g2497   contig12:236423-237780(-)